VPVEDVAELLAQWREAGGVWSRGRLVADGASRVARLRPDERRLLAVALAQQGAPHLADRLEAQAGDRLDPRYAQGITEALLSLEGEQVDDLVGALRHPERLRARADAALEHLPPPPIPREPPTETPAPRIEQPEPGSPPAPSRSAAEDADATRPPLEPPPERRAEPTAATPSTGAGTSRTGPTTSERDASGVVDRGRPDVSPPPARVTGRSATDPRGEGIVLTAALRRIEQAGSASERRAILTDLDGYDLTTTEALRVLDAVPDGWQRRRAVRLLLELGSLDGADPQAVLDRLSRAADRRFVAGALLAGGRLRARDLEPLLPAGTARRLAARAGR
jgi:hypothetical protein